MTDRSHAEQFLMGVNSPQEVLNKLAYNISLFRDCLDKASDSKHVEYQFIDASIAIKAASEWIHKHVKDNYDEDIRNIANAGLDAFAGVANTFKHKELDDRPHNKWVTTNYATTSSASSTFAWALPKFIENNTGARISALQLLEEHQKRLTELLARYP